MFRMQFLAMRKVILSAASGNAAARARKFPVRKFGSKNYEGPVYTSPITEDLSDYAGVDVSEQVIAKIKLKDADYRKNFDSRLPSWSDSEADEARRKRLIYRSKQRGFLEADLLLGSWAKMNVPTMTEVQLVELETLLREETLALFNYITKKEPLPAHLQALSIMPSIFKYTDTSNIHSPESYANLKKSTNML